MAAIQNNTKTPLNARVLVNGKIISVKINPMGLTFVPDDIWAQVKDSKFIKHHELAGHIICPKNSKLDDAKPANVSISEKKNTVSAKKKLKKQDSENPESES